MILIKTLKLDSEKKEDIKKACDLILNGEVVAIPTETVYGLGANALDKNAVLKIFKAKGRPQDNPLIIHISSYDMLESLVLEISQKAKLVMNAFWPGALTIIFKKSDIVPSEISCGLDTVAIRFPNHKTALEIIKTAGVPIAAPSANSSGKPSPTTATHVLDDLDTKISAIVWDTPCKVGVESTVLDLTGDKPSILRPGEVTVEQLQEVLGEVLIDFAVKEKISENAVVNSPGMKYRHYAPKADVTVLCGNSLDTANYINQVADEKSGVLCFDEYANFFKNENIKTFGEEFDISEQARNLFEKLRLFDELDISQIFAQCPNDDGLGLAVANRLKKSSGFNVIEIKKRKIIGLTGTSGSGKSTVSGIFNKLCAKVISADEIYHNLLENCDDMKREISESFDVDCKDIDRKKLGKIAFSDKSKLLKLNEITHKYITHEFEKELFCSINDEFIILDVPLMFEASYDKYCDKVIGVVSNEERKIERICKRDGVNYDYAKKRLESQKKDSFFYDKCDIIIKNNDDFSSLYKQCEEIYNKVRGERNELT